MVYTYCDVARNSNAIVACQRREESVPFIHGKSAIGRHLKEIVSGPDYCATNVRIRDGWTRNNMNVEIQS